MKLTENIAGLICVFLLITFIVTMFLDTSKATERISRDMQVTNNAIVSRQYSKYEGSKLNGSIVINAARQFKDNLKVTVKDGSRTIIFDKSTGTVNNRPSDSNYINPELLFTGNLNYDTNGSLVGITYIR